MVQHMAELRRASGAFGGVADGFFRRGYEGCPHRSFKIARQRLREVGFV